MQAMYRFRRRPFVESMLFSPRLSVIQLVRRGLSGVLWIVWAAPRRVYSHGGTHHTRELLAAALNLFWCEMYSETHWTKSDLVQCRFSPAPGAVAALLGT